MIYYLVNINKKFRISKHWKYPYAISSLLFSNLNHFHYLSKHEKFISSPVSHLYRFKRFYLMYLYDVNVSSLHKLVVKKFFFKPMNNISRYTIMFQYVHKLLYTKCYHSECRQKKSLFDRIFFDLFFSKFGELLL